ncbi:MAG: patatin-like phospholipase family protein [Proteobacteria bacterium]|nr:patatin-like phospholipase family protein [Pseudomonadota bacterium]
MGIRAHRRCRAVSGRGVAQPRKTLALALGAGGARGIAHIAVLEALDEMQIVPVAIAGASIGALIGAARASGMTGRAIRRHVIALAHDRAETLRRLSGARVAPFSISRLLAAPLDNPVLIDAEKFCHAFLPPAVPNDFSALDIPLTVVATDLSAARGAHFTAGALRPAIAASMAIPGLVKPVEIDGRLFIDGGAVDPLPFTSLRTRADVVIAVDCSGASGDAHPEPDPWETLFAALTIMGQTIVAEKLARGAPDLVIRPNVAGFRMLDFLQASAILRAADPVKHEIKDRLAILFAA